MSIKKISYIVVIILLVSMAIYLSSRKSVKCGEVCPASVTKQKEARIIPARSNPAAHHPKVTFIELGSVGCTPCNMMAPILDEIEKEYEGQVNVRFYDVRSLLGAPYGEKYKIQLIPTQVFLDKNGIEYYRHVGFFPKEEIVKILQLRGVK